MSENQLNSEHVINSLANKLTHANVELAEKDAVIIKLSQDNKQLIKDVENLKEQLAKKEKNNNKGSNTKKK